MPQLSFAIGRERTDVFRISGDLHDNNVRAHINEQLCDISEEVTTLILFIDCWPMQDLDPASHGSFMMWLRTLAVSLKQKKVRLVTVLNEQALEGCSRLSAPEHDFLGIHADVEITHAFLIDIVGQDDLRMVDVQSEESAPAGEPAAGTPRT